MKTLPPLNSLRCFLLAAKHLSFKQAASELNVTQAAVSQQIRILEDFLNRPMFIRGNRTVQLTDAGLLLLPFVQRGFDALTEGVQRLSVETNPNLLVISVLPSFAARWLMPRIGHFQVGHAQLTVRLEPTLHLADFDSEDIDVAVRYGGGHYIGLESRYLMPDRLYLVCHPSLVKDNPDPKTLVNRTPLLEEYPKTDSYNWIQYCQHMSIEPTHLHHALQINDSSMMIEALLAGQGLGLVRHSLVYRLVEQGQLAKPFEFSRQSDYSYYLVAPPQNFYHRKVRLFERWLMKTLKEEGLREDK